MNELIPITQKILEKNGFYFGYTSFEEDMMSTAGVSKEKGWVWDEGAGSVKIIFPNESDGGIIILSDQNFDRDINFFFVKTIYVNELQQLMNICRIDKEIVPHQPQVGHIRRAAIGCIERANSPPT